MVPWAPSSASSMGNSCRTCAGCSAARRPRLARWTGLRLQGSDGGGSAGLVGGQRPSPRLSSNAHDAQSTTPSSISPTRVGPDFACRSIVPGTRPSRWTRPAHVMFGAGERRRACDMAMPTTVRRPRLGVMTGRHRPGIGPRPWPRRVRRDPAPRGRGRTRCPRGPASASTRSRRVDVPGDHRCRCADGGRTDPPQGAVDRGREPRSTDASGVAERADEGGPKQGGGARPVPSSPPCTSG